MTSPNEAREGEAAAGRAVRATPNPTTAGLMTSPNKAHEGEGLDSLPPTSGTVAGPTPELERVAMAIWEAEWLEPFPPSGGIEHALAFQMARAALQALLPVSDGTVEAMAKTHGMKEVDAMVSFCAARNPGHRLGWADRGESPPLVQAFDAAINHIIGGTALNTDGASAAASTNPPHQGGRVDGSLQDVRSLPAIQAQGRIWRLR